MQIDVIGLGVEQPAQLTNNAISALAGSDMIIGSPRQLELVSGYVGSTRQTLFDSLEHFSAQLKSQLEQGTEKIAVLASGDPLWFGIGRWLSQFAMREASINLMFHPNISSLQAACHRLGVAMDAVQTISVHGRPLNSLRSQLRPNQQVLLLTDLQSTPLAIATLLQDIGFKDAKLTVLERLGYSDERITQHHVTRLVNHPEVFDPLLVCLVETGSNHHQPVRWPTFPGFDDRLFSTDKGNGQGMITKREVRLQILSLLSPAAGDCIWDIGAGCGSVSVELAYWCAQANIIAIEQHPDRLYHLRQNQLQFGVERNLRVVAGTASDALTSPLAELPAPNKIFIGGSGGELESLLSSCWQRLAINGYLLVSAVMEPTRYSAWRFCEAKQRSGTASFDTLQVNISRGESLAGQLCYRPALPVTLLRLQKLAPDTNEVSYG